MIELAGRQAGRSTVPAKYQVAYDEIVRRIQAGIYQPKQPLPPIRELAAELAVGQSTLKTALMLLEKDGWTRGQQGDRIYVTDEPPGQGPSAD